MRAPLPLWPATFRGWLPGLLLSVPLALLMWNLRTAPEDLRTAVATAAVLLALPWVVPAMVLVATVSVPLYMWLHTQGPVPDVLQWLGGKGEGAAAKPAAPTQAIDADDLPF